jgi:hypothetical protein
VGWRAADLSLLDLGDELSRGSMGVSAQELGSGSVASACLRERALVRKKRSVSLRDRVIGGSAE